MNPKDHKTPKGIFSTWTSNYDGTVKEVGLYRSVTGTVEKKLFTNISDALNYGFKKDYHHRTGITFDKFLNECVNGLMRGENE